MDEEATQPATQPFDDPRRRGIRSELSEQEYGDVILELHPSSPAAHIAVRLTAAATPQHILQNHFMSPDDDFGIDEGPTQDIALRFSSKVHDLGLGFVFGRNPSKCDILLSDSPGSTISNRHFRIFLRDNGVAMIQDTSTNGTILNSDVLHAQKGNIGRGDGMYTIKILDTIEIPLHGEQAGSSLRFLVKEPSRGLAGDVRYERNKEAYLECVRQAQRQAAVVAQAVATSDAPPAVPVSFAAVCLPRDPWNAI